MENGDAQFMSAAKALLGSSTGPHMRRALPRHIANHRAAAQIGVGAKR